MMRSFFNAVTGLNAYRTWMDITADNMANVNTIGFKGSRPIFQDVISTLNPCNLRPPELTIKPSLLSLNWPSLV